MVCFYKDWVTVNPHLGLSEVQAMADAQLLDEAKIDKERIIAETRNLP